MERAIYDLPRLFAFRETLDRLDSAAPPTVRGLYPEVMLTPRRIGLLCGSFNPLTLAHTELAEYARKAARLDLGAVYRGKSNGGERTRHWAESGRSLALALVVRATTWTYWGRSCESWPLFRAGAGIPFVVRGGG